MELGVFMQELVASKLSSPNFTQGEVWVFVRVIDNWGDVGVGWRLAMQLAQCFPWQVRLWIDNTTALDKLVPLAEQAVWQSKLTVESWLSDAELAVRLKTISDPVMVIETFGCDLPQVVLQRMVVCQPLWLNWEYLTAEDWAVDLQAMPSLQNNGLAKYFWFMGIDVNSGGLLRETDYLSRRAEFLLQPDLQQNFKQQYGLPLQHVGQLWLLFAYASEHWNDWLAMWREAGTPMTLWLAGREIVDCWRCAGLIPENALQNVGDKLVIDNLTMVRIPFVPQSAFDCLLWLVDAAVVRGEDSFVRAQWAGIPFLWHIYQQQEAAHMCKLDAFWQKVTVSWPTNLRQSLLALSADMNGENSLEKQERLAAWQNLCSEWKSWVNAAAGWSESLHLQSTAMERLARFSQIPLK